MPSSSTSRRRSARASTPTPRPKPGVLLDTGVTVGELTGLRVRAVRLEEGTLQVLGKGNRESRVPVGKGLKRLKYPIRRDAFGRSPRQRAFQAFGDGKRPAEVSRMVGISLRTACHSFADWKKHPEALDARYRLAAAVKKHPEMWGSLIATVSTAPGMSQKEVVARFQKPWGLKQLLMGKWPNYAEERVRREWEARLMTALKLITLVKESKLTLEQIVELVRAFVQKYRPHGPR